MRAASRREDGNGSVIVAFENSKTAWRVKEILEAGGAASCVVCRSADQVRRTVHKLHVPAVVCGYKLGDQTAELLFDDLPLSCAMLVLASQSMLELMQNDDIFRLPTPVSRGDLAASVRMLLQMGRRLERYVRPRRSREEQELIDQAKAPADGPERHDGGAGPPLFAEKKHGQRGKISPDGPAGAGQHRTGIAGGTRRSRGGSRERGCRRFYRKGERTMTDTGAPAGALPPGI